MKNKIKKIFKMIKCLFLYIKYYFYCKIKKINNDDIWLISERGIDARDNGIHFYRYMKKNHPEIKVKYVISLDSADSDKIDEEDIVNYGSKEHFILFLSAGKLISTHIMGYSPDTSLFWRLDKCHLLKLKGKKVFLQHGIINNFVPSLEKDVTKLDLFITSAKGEYDFIMQNYGYDDKILKCTGMARYDKLVNNKKNQILVMPTFRKWLNYEDDFVKTEYFIKWNGLLNNEQLINYLEKENIILYFYPHYEIQKYIDCFNIKTKNIIIADFKKFDVQTLLIESKMLITDYSSVYFDFAYMGKPVVYYQFDREKYWSNHYKKGYFDYEQDGFGPVCFEEKKVVDNIINSSFEKYKIRREKFFMYRDTHNCERIYNEIKKL